MGMKMDRGVIQLARDRLSVEQIAAKMKLKAEAVIKTGGAWEFTFRRSSLNGTGDGRGSTHEIHHRPSLGRPRSCCRQANRDRQFC
jgi:hypothetical protein